MHSAPSHLCRFLVRFFFDVVLSRVHVIHVSLHFSHFSFSLHVSISLHSSDRHRKHHLCFPSGFAFQLSIRVRFTQLEILFMLEPLGFRPNGFSRFFSLLMSTFSLLIALVSWISPFLTSKSYRLPFPRSTERSTTSLDSLFNFPLLMITASASYLVSCISGAKPLILYVVTRFLTDGCFQAHRQVVIGISLPFALSMKFETLSIDLGCFPLNVQYLSTAVGLRSLFCRQFNSQFTPDRYTLTCPHWYRALPYCPPERALLKQLS